VVSGRCLQKITFAQMRKSGDRWLDDKRLSDLEPRFVCTACGKRGAEVRPDFNWNRKPIKVMGFR
jgi:hypothetical protein